MVLRSTIANSVSAGHHAGTFSGIENRLRAILFESITVGMPVQRQVLIGSDGRQAPMGRVPR